jgi:putative membrane protein
MMDMMNGGMAAWTLVWIILAGGLVALGVGLAARRGLKPTKDHRRTAPTSTAHDAPLELLRRRYAAGEIDEDEYLTRRSGLSQ